MRIIRSPVSDLQDAVHRLCKFFPEQNGVAHVPQVHSAHPPQRPKHITAISEAGVQSDTALHTCVMMVQVPASAPNITNVLEV